MNKKNLYHVKSGCDSMHVIATSWQNAIMKWKKKLLKDHNDFQETRQMARFKAIENIEEPLGVDYVADSSDLIL